jgi:phosphoserine phosphatase RsbU/P
MLPNVNTSHAHRKENVRMRILVADDDAPTRFLLEEHLAQWGYEVVMAKDGDEALAVLSDAVSPNLVILDRVMPGLDGLEVCRRVSQRSPSAFIYIILLTVKDDRADVIAGFEAGADDYVTKPFDTEELRARIAVGRRMVELQLTLNTHVDELQKSLAQVKKLEGILPICGFCHKIRDDQDAWQRIDEYITEHSEVQFSHSLCPDCLNEHYPEDGKCMEARSDEGR